MDIVEKLRSYSNRSGYAKYCHIAADTIQSLKAENNHLKTELRLIYCAIDDTAIDTTKTAVECIQKLQEDAKRYRWLKQAKSLTLRTDGSTWTKNGVKFMASHYLAEGDTKHAVCETLDETIDTAINIMKHL